MKWRKIVDVVFKTVRKVEMSNFEGGDSKISLSSKFFNVQCTVSVHTVMETLYTWLTPNRDQFNWLFMQNSQTWYNSLIVSLFYSTLSHRIDRKLATSVGCSIHEWIVTTFMGEEIGMRRLETVGGPRTIYLWVLPCLHENPQFFMLCNRLLFTYYI